MGRHRCITIVGANQPAPPPPVVFTFDDINVTGVLSQTGGSYLVSAVGSGGGYSFDSTWSYRGVSFKHIFKIDNEGTQDLTFSVGAGFGLSIGTYAANAPRGPISKMLDAGSGKAYVIGNFDTFNGTATQKGIIRLNANGTKDTTFNNGGAGLVVTGGYNGPGLTNQLVDAVLTSDGGIVVLVLNANDTLGTTIRYNGTLVPSIFKIKADGTLDTTFIGCSIYGISGVSPSFFLDGYKLGLVNLPGDLVGIYSNYITSGAYFKKYGVAGDNRNGVFFAVNQSATLQYIILREVSFSGDTTRIFSGQGSIATTPKHAGYYKYLSPVVVVDGFLYFIANMTKTGQPDYKRQIMKFTAATGAYQGEYPVSYDYYFTKISGDGTDVAHNLALVPVTGGIGLVSTYQIVGNIKFRINGSATDYQFVSVDKTTPTTLLAGPRNDIITSETCNGLIQDVNGDFLMFGNRVNAGQLPTQFSGLIRMNSAGSMENVF